MLLQRIRAQLLWVEQPGLRSQILYVSLTAQRFLPVSRLSSLISLRLALLLFGGCLVPFVCSREDGFVNITTNGHGFHGCAFHVRRPAQDVWRRRRDRGEGN